MRKIFVPIKDHSSRVPGKNFRDFGGVPLYERLLDKYSDKSVRVYVDTDSDRIIEKYAEGGFSSNVMVYRRERNLCGDDVSVNFLINNFVGRCCEKGDLIAQLHATNPFLSPFTVCTAFDLLDCDSEWDSIVSANVIQSRLWREEEYGYCPINHNPMKMEKTQDLPLIYEENSCFYAFTYESFKQNNNRIGLKPYFYKMEFPENLDIDTEEDWDLCVNMLDTIEERL